MARAIYLEALSAVDPTKILKERIRIEKDLLWIKIGDNSERGF